MAGKLSWYAVYTKPFWEKKVSGLLDRMNIENYCPVQKVVRQWSDRKKTLYEPLFKSYVFVHVTEKDISYVREVQGVINFVTFLGKPAVIRDNEIVTIRQFLNDYENVQVEKMTFEVNDRVKVIGGPFQNMGGNVVEIKNKTIRVLLPSFSYILSAEFEKSNLEKTITEEVYNNLHSN